MWFPIKSVIQENMNIILGALILSPQKSMLWGANLQIFGHERIWWHFHSAIMELYRIVGVTVRPRPYIYIFFLRKESNMSLKARPEGQTEQSEKWQEEQTPSKPLTEKKI